MYRCLVTGGAGFIGSNLAIELVQRGWTVRVMDSFHTGRLENLVPVFDDIEVLREDIRNLEAVRRAGGEVFNIATGSRTTLNELIHILKQFTGAEIEPIYYLCRPGDILHSWADISKAREILGYKPKFNLEKGLIETVEWFRSSGMGKEEAAAARY